MVQKTAEKLLKNLLKNLLKKWLKKGQTRRPENLLKKPPCRPKTRFEKALKKRVEKR